MVNVEWSVEASFNINIQHSPFRKTNDVRLHGGGVGALKVALTAAEPSYLPPEPSQPCSQVSSLEAIPVSW
jgi:hypothetical protein